MTYREKWIYLNILLLCLWWWYYPPMIFSVFCLACHQRWMSHWCNIRRCHTSSWLRVLTVYAYAFETMFYKQCCQPDFTAHWYICLLKHFIIQVQKADLRCSDDSSLDQSATSIQILLQLRYTFLIKLQLYPVWHRRGHFYPLLLYELKQSCWPDFTAYWYICPHTDTFHFLPCLAQKGTLLSLSPLWVRFCQLIFPQNSKLFWRCKIDINWVTLTPYTWRSLYNLLRLLKVSP